MEYQQKKLQISSILVLYNLKMVNMEIKLDEKQKLQGKYSKTHQNLWYQGKYQDEEKVRAPC